MNAGFAKADVTPPLGMPLEGLGQKVGCTAIHDPLFVRALALEHEGRRALIIGCDLLFFERGEIARYKDAIGAVCGLSHDDILLNCSHNHAGPRLTHWKYSAGGDADYLDRIGMAMCDAVREAFATCEPVRLEAGMAETQMPMSRRRRNANGRVDWGPSPTNVTCTKVPVCLVRRADGSVLSILFSVACHPSTFYECVISADYPGVAQRLLNERFETGGALFLQGCGGDTKARQIADGEYCFDGSRGFSAVEEAGREVADAVTGVIAAGLAPMKPALLSRMRDVRWPLTPAPERYLLERIARDAGESERGAWAREMLGQLDAGADWSAVPVRVHGLKLAEGLRIVGLEGEAVAELGNRIHAVFPDGITFALGYTDGAQIYLPVSSMLQEGGYEVDSAWEYHWPSELARGGDELLLDAVRALRDAGF